MNTFRDTEWIEDQGSIHSSGTMRAVAIEEDPDIIEQAYMDLLGRQPDGPGYCLLYTSPSPRDKRQSRMPSSA